MARRVYTGPGATVFNGIGPVRPGVPFEVPESLLPGLDRRSDIADPEAPEATEDSSASQEADTSGAGRPRRRGRSGAPNGKNDTGETAVP